jgi:hypothetical protein
MYFLSWGCTTMSVEKKGIELREGIQLHMGKIAVKIGTYFSHVFEKFE